MATKLPQDLGRLRDECAARFADNPVARYVTRTIIKGIVVLWTDDQQGIPESEAIRIDVSLSPIFDALMGAPTMQEAYEHLAELVAAWEKIDPFAAGIGDWPTFEFNQHLRVLTADSPVAQADAIAFERIAPGREGQSA